MMLKARKKNIYIYINITLQCSSRCSVVVHLKAEHQPTSLTARNPPNAVSFDTMLRAGAEALEGSPITVASPHRAKPVSLLKPASLSCFQHQFRGAV